VVAGYPVCDEVQIWAYCWSARHRGSSRGVDSRAESSPREASQAATPGCSSTPRHWAHRRATSSTGGYSGGAGGIVNISTTNVENYNLTVNSTQDSRGVIQDFYTMKSLRNLKV
jgi:hypothetical protein